MARKAKTVFGFCPTHADAEEAVDRLRLSGFRNTDVSALMPDTVVFRGVLGWTAGPGIPAHEMLEYEPWVKGGGILLCVRCDNADWLRRAEQVLERSAVAATAC